jgi:hypothetical protein
VHYAIDHHFWQRDIQPLQFLANEFPFRFTEALAYLTLEPFESFFVLATPSPMLVNELQQALKGLPANPRSRHFFIKLRYTSHGPISGGYL